MRKRPNDVEKLDKISNSIDADGKGNAEIKNNLKIDGNLKFKSLVSDSNPEGIFDPTGSGGGTGGGGGTTEKYNHIIQMYNSTMYIIFNLTTTSNTKITNYSQLFSAVRNKYITAAGYIVNDSKNCIVVSLSLKDSYSFYAGNYDLSNPAIKTTLVGVSDINLSDTIE